MFRSLRYARWPRESSLSVFDLVPDFGVFLPARHVLPEINLLHICVGVVEMQAFHLVRREQLRRHSNVGTWYSCERIDAEDIQAIQPAAFSS